MIKQFGIVTLFVAAFPLGPLFAFIGVLFRIRINAKVLLCLPIYLLFFYLQSTALYIISNVNSVALPCAVFFINALRLIPATLVLDSVP